MKILYYDCFAGISGDMNLGALIDLGVDSNYLFSELNKLSIADEFKIEIEKKQKMGITGTKVDVILKNDEKHYHHHHDHNHKEIDGQSHDINHNHNHDDDHTHSHDHTHHHDHKHNHDVECNNHTHSHEHRNLESIYGIIDESPYNENIKKISKEIFLNVAKAEAKVHGKDIQSVHFHEVGAVDSIVDIIGAAICFDVLKVDNVMASTVELGGGFVRCAHGLMPVPAPATVEILKDIPTHVGKVPFETTTPTGAAILKTLVNEFTDDLNFKIVKTGYGLGTKDFTIPNVLRVYIAEVTDMKKREQTIIEVNIDDMNAEFYSDIEEQLFKKGALDVYKTPIIMKKGRPAIILSVLTESDNVQEIEEIIFKETSTLGLRKYKVEKVMLDREFETICTKYGDIIIKKGIWNGKVIKWKPEYEVCKRVAKDNGISIREVYQEVNRQWGDVSY